MKKTSVLNETEICTKALKVYGEESQVVMVFEEMAELQKELCKILRSQSEFNATQNIKIRKKIAEEIADVEIMLRQMKILYEIEDAVEDAREFKLERLSQRLEDV